jgi:hypothetical protein
MTIELSDSRCIAKLQIKTPVPGALRVLEIHERALHGLDHEVQTAPIVGYKLRSSGTGASPYNRPKIA